MPINKYATVKTLFPLLLTQSITITNSRIDKTFMYTHLPDHLITINESFIRTIKLNDFIKNLIVKIYATPMLRVKVEEVFLNVQDN